MYRLQGGRNVIPSFEVKQHDQAETEDEWEGSRINVPCTGGGIQTEQGNTHQLPHSLFSIPLNRLTTVGMKVRQQLGIEKLFQG